MFWNTTEEAVEELFKNLQNKRLWGIFLCNFKKREMDWKGMETITVYIFKIILVNC